MGEIPSNKGCYLLTAPNNKIYVGSATNLSKRLTIDYPKYERSERNRPIENAIKKYGWNNFKIEILTEFLQIENTELLALETAFIEFYNSTDNSVGYNVCLIAGNTKGIKATEITRKKLSKITSGKNNPRFGQKLTNEIKNKISLNHADFTGQNNPHFGKQHSEAAKLMISQKKSKALKQIDSLTKEVIKIWPSASIASKELNIHVSNICKVCNQTKDKNGYTIKTAGNFMWERC